MAYPLEYGDNPDPAMTSLPQAIQFVDYDSRTDVISPRGKVYIGRQAIAAILDNAGYTVRKPVIGWGQFTHLIQPGSGGWALAKILKGE